jgi:hypothetical protein
MSLVPSHEFKEMGYRRWCLGCGMFQYKRADQFAEPKCPCPQDTPYAYRKRMKSLAILLSDHDPADASP